MKLFELYNINEGKNHPVICVDVQPEYSGMNDGDEDPTFVEIINFVADQTGPVLMFVNAEDQGMTRDTVSDIQVYWNDTLCDADWEYDEETDEHIMPDCKKEMDWNRVQIVDKGYGYFRMWMDEGVSPKSIIRVIRYMYQNNHDSSEEIDHEILKQLVQESEFETCIGDDLYINWTSVAQLKKFNGAYIVGGGREECLREVELLMSAFNIKYKRIDSLVYG